MPSVLLKRSSYAVISHRKHRKGMGSLPEQRFWGCFWSKPSTVAVLFPLALLWQTTETGLGRVGTVTRLMVLQGKESETECLRPLKATLLQLGMWRERRWHLTWEAMTCDVGGQWHMLWGVEPPFHTLIQNSTFLEKPLTALTTSHCPGPERPHLSSRFRDL